MIISYYSFILICCMIFLGALAISILAGTDRQMSQHFMLLLLACTILWIGSDIVWKFVETGVLASDPRSNYSINCLYFITSGACGYGWFVYLEKAQKTKLSKNNSILGICTIPILLLILLVLNSPITGWIFYLSDNGQAYHRGNLYILHPILGYGYIVFAAVLAFIRYFKKEYSFNRPLLLSIICYTLLGGIAIVCQVFFPEMPCAPVGITGIIALLHIALEKQKITLDPLTRVNNRRNFISYTQFKIENAKDYKDLYLLVIDVDYFKKITRQYGTEEGDRVLTLIATCLKNTARHTDYYLGRLGGDVFVFLCEISHEAVIEEFAQRITNDISVVAMRSNLPYPLSVSTGYAKYTKDVPSIEELIRMADRKLYEGRKSRHY